MHKNVERVLIPRDQIDVRVRELAAQIANDFRDESGGDEPPELTIVSILTGSLIFLADLIRNMPLMLRLRMITVRSYPGKSMTSQPAEIEGRLPDDLTGQHVLIVDDILDSGQTITLVRDLLAERNPASVRTVMFLRKDTEPARETHVEYVGFDVPDEFVVGYGLDFDGYYRNLPDVVTLKREALK
ncbi:MAG: hypoxanthine phosphoribosyltransferase [Phycisphaera sp.]|nr:hypoxanthine phosphoribosyltransferase [Phycisphaera sp.]